MKYALALSAALLLTICSLSAQALYDKEPLEAKGNLVIIGGGELTPDIMETIITLGGGPDNAKILVVPYARKVPHEVGPRHVGYFKDLGVKNVDVMQVAPAQVDKPENLAMLDGVNVVFFSGGDQILLENSLRGTEFLRRIQKLYQDGGTIAGTSAGATVQGRVTLTGKPSFEFLKSVVIHQHFAERKRQKQLFNSVIKHPNLRGIGIDESTAILVPPDGKCEVLGYHSVTFIEPAEKPADGQQLKKFKMLVLYKGDTYQL